MSSYSTEDADIRTSLRSLIMKEKDMPEMKRMKNTLAASMGGSGRLTAEEEDDDEASRTAIASYHAKEEEIERRKIEVKKKVESHLSRAEDQAKHLAHVWEELEVFADPTRKELTNARKKLDMASKDLKSLAQICQKKEKEYKEVMEAFQEKSKEKAQLTTALVELLGQSEKFRMQKLEELSKFLNLKP